MNNKYFQTNDLALCAALLCSGLSIIDIDKTNLKRVFFLFEKNRKNEIVIDKYWKHELLVDPINYFNALKELKTRIYENKYEYESYNKSRN